MKTDHIIKFIGEGKLSYCTRCHGGESELDESCAKRLAKERNSLKRENEQLRRTITQQAAHIALIEDIPF